MPSPQHSPGKVLLGLSGNILSSVVAALLKHQGFQVHGLHLTSNSASQAEAERVSRKLGISLIVEDCTEQVKEYVVDHIVHQVLSNRRPEPEVLGHQKILFERLISKANELGCDKLATGHSARVMLDPSTGLTRLLRGTDGQSDQSHLMFGLPGKELRKFILPIGDLGSGAVERLAIEMELDPEKIKNPKPGFCSVAEDYFFNVAEAGIPSTMKVTGQIKTQEGSVLGDHAGLYRFYRGQSKGLPVAREKLGNRVVLEMIPSTQTLVVGPEEHLLRRETVVERANWVQPLDLIKGTVCEARLSRDLFAKCRVTQFKYGYVHVEFSSPQKSVTPGQAVVFYAGDELLGGGFAV